MSKSMKEKSSVVYEGPDRVAQRSLLRAAGFPAEDIGKPLIAVVNSWTEIVPGHAHLRELAEQVKAGIREAGGMPAEFNTIAVCDGIAMQHRGMHYSLPSRDLISSTIEIMINAHGFDAMVLIGSCDKVIPGMLIAACRLNIPAIMVNGGPMEAGKYKGRTNLSSGDAYEVGGRWRRGEMSDADMLEFEQCCCPSVGSCSHMATANTMSVASESLGMMLPGTSTVLATSPERKKVAYETGKQVMTLLKDNIRPLDIINRKSLENAMRMVLTVAGSTNLALHIPAIAHNANIPFTIDDIDTLSVGTPYIANITPCGTYPIQEFHSAGGVQAVFKEMGDLIHTDVLTVTGKLLKDHLANVERPTNRDLIKKVDDPIRKEGGLTVLRGNLAEEGCIVKSGGVPHDMLQFEAPAKVFDSEPEAMDFIFSYKSKEKLVVVLRYEGPQGGPGMREMLGVTGALYGMQLEHQVAVVTDGRYSGASKGLAIGHVSPEASAGGLIAYVKNGDTIRIDVINRQINLLITDEEIAKRKKEMPQPEMVEGMDVLSLYASLVGSPSQGATLKGKKRIR